MRCKACDTQLTDYECTRKDKLTGDYLDLCSHCHSYSSEYVSDYETTVDTVVDFGKEDVYNLSDGYRKQYKED